MTPNPHRSSEGGFRQTLALLRRGALGERAAGDARFVGLSVMGSVIPILMAPVLTRVYVPAELGPYNAYSILVLALGTMATGRLESLVPVVRIDRRAWQIARSALLLAVCFTAAVSLPWLVLTQPVGALDPRLVRWFLPLGLLCFAADALAAALLTRRDALQAVGVARGAQGIARPVLQLWPGQRLAGGMGLYLGAVVAQAGAVAAMLPVLLRSAPAWAAPSRATPGERLVRLRRFVVIGMVAGGANVLSVQAMLIVLALVIDPATYGIIAMTAALAGIPVTLLVPSLRQLLQRDLGVLLRGNASGDRIWRMVTHHLIRILPFAMLVLVGSWLAGPAVMPWLLGEEWRASGTYVGPLAAAMAMQLMISPLAAVFPMTGALGWQLGLDLARGGAAVAWILLAAAAGATPMTLVIGSVAVSIAGYLAVLACIRIVLLRRSTA